MADSERKIIIDEGWKEQVERERQEAASKLVPSEEAPEDAGDDEISLFENLLSGLAAQTMMALGVVAPQGEEQVFIDLGLAKHLIDTLMMLREKTAGNLSPVEERAITQAIGELQRIFAIRAQQVRDAAMKQSGTKPNPLIQS